MKKSAGIWILTLCLHFSGMESVTAGRYANIDLSTSVVSEPTWRDYGSTYRDAQGNTQNLRMEVPLFRVVSIQTRVIVPLDNGGAVLNRAGISGHASQTQETGMENDVIAKKILAELNLARTQPHKFATFVEQHRKKFKDATTYTAKGNMNIRTQEGVKAVDEAIEFLKKVKPIGPLTLSPGLGKAAADHVQDLGRTGATGHQGTDKSQPRDRIERYGQFQKTCGENLAFGSDDPRDIVMQLIVDDGVPDRGHRTNIFNPDFKTVGIATGPHPQYRHMCAMSLAGGFVERKKAKRP